MADFFEKNLKVLKERFPEVVDFAISIKGTKFGVLKAQDGGLVYAVKRPDGQWQPQSNPINPKECAQRSVDMMSERLNGGMCPAVVVGISPGYVLDTVYRIFSEKADAYHPFRHIYVLVNSPLCLCAWLALADREKLLRQPEVEFLLASKTGDIAALCERDLSRSHHFIPVSELPPLLVDKIIEPLSRLYLKREAEAESWHKENEAYYSSIADGELAKVIQGKAGRKPRLMMPTHTSSTVIQFSARDTCELFEARGWETKAVKIERDLPPWHLIKAIRDFKPDLFIFIDHLRTEDAGARLYPKDMLFATWVQDSLPSINSKKAAEEWNRATEGRNRDFLIGYVDQLDPYDYRKASLIPMPMVVNARIFHPVELSEEDKAKYECDVCFASNRGETTESVVENILLPALSAHGFTLEILKEVHDALWISYREGGSFTSYATLQERLLKIGSFGEVFEALDEESRDYVIQRTFWLLNDLIYRHVILEWLDDYAQAHPGFKLNLYGRDWAKHPRFGKYAAGVLEHGPELNKAFNAAKHCLHLNALEGAHQRQLEICSSGGRLLTRVLAEANDKLLFHELALKLSLVFSDAPKEEVRFSKEEIERLFALTESLAKATPRRIPGRPQELRRNAFEMIMAWTKEQLERSRREAFRKSFLSKEGLTERLLEDAGSAPPPFFAYADEWHEELLGRILQELCSDGRISVLERAPELGLCMEMAALAAEKGMEWRVAELLGKGAIAPHGFRLRLALAALGEGDFASFAKLFPPIQSTEDALKAQTAFKDAFPKPGDLDAKACEEALVAAKGGYEAEDEFGLADLSRQIMLCAGQGERAKDMARTLIASTPLSRYAKLPDLKFAGEVVLAEGESPHLLAVAESVRGDNIRPFTAFGIFCKLRDRWFFRQALSCFECSPLKTAPYAYYPIHKMLVAALLGARFSEEEINASLKDLQFAGSADLWLAVLLRECGHFQMAARHPAWMRIDGDVPFFFIQKAITFNLAYPQGDKRRDGHFGPSGFPSPDELPLDAESAERVVKMVLGAEPEDSFIREFLLTRLKSPGGCLQKELAEAFRAKRARWSAKREPGFLSESLDF